MNIQQLNIMKFKRCYNEKDSSITILLLFFGGAVYVIERGVNYADIYAKQVRKKPKKYPDTIKAMVDCYYKWKKCKDIWFDVDRANEMMDWVETFVRHTKGDLAGQPFILDIWMSS